LGQELSAQLSRVCARREASGFAGLLATFAVLLGLESGQRDIVLTTPVDTRGYDGADLVGCFVNTVVLRITVEPDDTLEQVLAAAATSLTGALDHSGVPFARVLAATGSRRRSEPMPFGAVGIVHNNAPLGPLAWAGLEVTHHPLRPRHVKHAFALSVGRTPDGWVGQLEHSGRYSAERAKSVVARWTEIVRVFVDRPETRVAECAGAGR
jgi:non-ribosomal peptide synthetase component F